MKEVCDMSWGLSNHCLCDMAIFGLPLKHSGKSFSGLGQMSRDHFVFLFIPLIIVYTNIYVRLDSSNYFYKF
jgi:hypothetical protein